MPNMRILPAYLQEIAIRELNEVPDRIYEDINNLRLWIEEQPHLRARTDDQFLLSFLRGCKHSLPKAKYKIDRYYTLKTKLPNYYTIHNMDFSRALELVSLGVGLKLPTPLNDHGQRIALIRAGGYPTDKFTFEDVMCVASALQEITIREDDYAVVNGYTDLFDLGEVTTGHFFQLTTSTLRKMSNFVEEAVPMRQGTTHFINAPSAFANIFNGLSIFMPAKQKQRIKVHGSNLENLYNSIPQHFLPMEYGGKNGSVAELITEALNTFKHYKEYFIEDREYGVDETLRPKLMNYD